VEGRDGKEEEAGGLLEGREGGQESRGGRGGGGGVRVAIAG